MHIFVKIMLGTYCVLIILFGDLIVLTPARLSFLVAYTESVNPVEKAGVLFEHRISKVRRQPGNSPSWMWMCTRVCLPTPSQHHSHAHTLPHTSHTSLHTPSMLNLPPINQKHNFALTGKISFGPHMTREPISFPVKTPSNAAKLPDSAACRNQIQSEITANHLSQ